MVIVSVLYLLVIYLVFHKFKLLPWNTVSKLIALIVGVIILSGFLVGLQGLTPSSTQALISGYVTEIAPQVSGRVVEAPAEPNVELDPGTVLYRIDPLPYQYRVDQLKAQLADTEASVAQLKDSYDAARAQTAATQAQLELTTLRLGRRRRRLPLRARAVRITARAAPGAARGQPGQRAGRLRGPDLLRG